MIAFEKRVRLEDDRVRKNVSVRRMIAFEKMCPFEERIALKNVYVRRENACGNRMETIVRIGQKRVQNRMETIVGIGQKRVQNRMETIVKSVRKTDVEVGRKGDAR